MCCKTQRIRDAHHWDYTNDRNFLVALIALKNIWASYRFSVILCNKSEQVFSKFRENQILFRILWRNVFAFFFKKAIFIFTPKEKERERESKPSFVNDWHHRTLLLFDNECNLWATFLYVSWINRLFPEVYRVDVCLLFLEYFNHQSQWG